ncbi:hypothetical protein NQ315_010977 [Exocentrus adspersus]|uniref:YqaJ viral recombinase domain-containing protein n=1 Tax=Exocentrus adspersus TaxID=1586481 RepID=A0AAV8VGM7_9CUCU|nr:hypothetical protein NQ315_010977 [Exocentrus adspersus]
MELLPVGVLASKLEYRQKYGILHYPAENATRLDIKHQPFQEENHLSQYFALLTVPSTIQRVAWGQFPGTLLFFVDFEICWPIFETLDGDFVVLRPLKRLNCFLESYAVSPKLNPRDCPHIPGHPVYYGVTNESHVLKDLSVLIKLTITPCGMFVHPVYHFLAATPDGLLGSEGLVEIKCPSSASDLTPESAIHQRKITFWNKEGQINKNHNYYHQVQGQLQVTGRSYCVFAVWTPLGLKYETILKDEEFWKSKMEIQLRDFYMNAMLPELVDSRKNTYKYGIKIKTNNSSAIPNETRKKL